MILMSSVIAFFLYELWRFTALNGDLSVCLITKGDLPHPPQAVPLPRGEGLLHPLFSRFLSYIHGKIADFLYFFEKSGFLFAFPLGKGDHVVVDEVRSVFNTNIPIYQNLKRCAHPNAEVVV